MLAGEEAEYAPRFSNMAHYGAPILEFVAVTGLWSVARGLLLDPLTESQSPQIQQWFQWAYLAGLAVFAGRLVWRLTLRFIRMRFRELAVTNRRFVEKDGVFNVEFWATDLEKIVRVAIEQPWLGRIFNYGAVTIVTVGEVSHTTRDVADPASLQHALHARMQGATVAA